MNDWGRAVDPGPGPGGGGEGRPLATQLALTWLCEVNDGPAHGYTGDLPSQGRLIMSRLADYFAIVGYDHIKDRKTRCFVVGRVIGVGGVGGGWLARVGVGGRRRLLLDLSSGFHCRPHRPHCHAHHLVWGGRWP